MGYLANGAGGGSTNDLGFYIDLTALQAAHAVGVSGQFAVLGSTDTIWVWDADTAGWKNTGTSALGDVVGPVSAVDSNFAAYDGITGKLIKDSGSKASDFATPSNSLKLDQTTPQEIINGIPTLESTRIISTMHQLVDKAYVDQAVTSLGQHFYMLSTASGVETYYNTQITPSVEVESSVTVTDAIDNALIAGWISPTTGTPPKIIAGIYEWHLFAAKTGAGTKTFRIYWTLSERKADNSEVIIATSSESNILATKADLAISLTVNSDYTLTAGSRIVGKAYVRLVSGISAANVVVYSEGASDSHWEIPTNKEILDTIYVPYTGATGLVDLGAESLKCANIQNQAGEEILGLDSKELISNGSAIASWNDEFRLIDFTSSADVLFDTTSLTDTRTLTIPDATGTIALTSDIPDVSSFITTVSTDGVTITGDGVTTPLSAVAGGGGQTLYDAIVAPSGGDYTTLGDALNAGKKNIFIRVGTYNETFGFSHNNCNITGENRITTILNWNTSWGWSSFTYRNSFSNLTIKIGNYWEAYFSDTFDNKFNNVHFHFIGTSGYLALGNSTYGFKFDNCIFEHNDGGDNQHFSFGGQSNSIVNSLFRYQATKTTGKSLVFGGNRWSVIGNRFQVTGGSQVQLEINCGNSNFCGNIVDNTNSDRLFTIQKGSSYLSTLVKDNVGFPLSANIEQINMKNNSGSIINGFEIVTLDLTNPAEQVTRTTTIGDKNVLGVSNDGGIAIGSYGSVQTTGLCEYVKVDGSGAAIAIGDYITTSSVAGVGIKAVAGNTAIGIAMATASTATNIKVLLITPKVI